MRANKGYSASSLCVFICVTAITGCYDNNWTDDYYYVDRPRSADTAFVLRPEDTFPEGVNSKVADWDTDVPDEWDSDTLVDIVGDGDPFSVSIYGAPMMFAPTGSSFGVNAIVEKGNRRLLKMRVRGPNQAWWSAVESTPTLLGDDVVEWTAEGLRAGEIYEYSIYYETGNLELVELYRGEVVTKRPAGEAFSFVLITDTHLHTQYMTEEMMDDPELTLLQVAQDIRAAASPDFLFHLGDVIDFHQFGFNDPPPDGTSTRFGYLSYRNLLGHLLGNTHHFMVIGNWEGENGDYTKEEIMRSRRQRFLYAPGPEPTTYPEGGSLDEDYYAFTWGDALFITLNVMSYTFTSHLLSYYPGVPDDWTLGEEQMMWLEETLAAADAKWRFIMIHHPVGGNAGDFTNSAYGRGGGRAADVGEQALVHELMMAHDVRIMFYGHDHVFTDMVVDDIHYTLPGSAGAPPDWRFSSSITGYPDGTYWTDSGHGLVEVTPEFVEVQLIAMGGELLDSYTIE